MAMQGVVNLSKVPFETLVGRRFKDDFSEEGLIFNLGHGDLVIKVSPCDSVWGSGDPESGRRVRVWAPRLDMSGWVWQSTTGGIAMIEWLPFEASLSDRSPPSALVKITAEKTEIKSKPKSWLARMTTSTKSVTQLERGQILFRYDDADICDDPCKCAVSFLDDTQRIVAISEDDLEELHAPLDAFVNYCEQAIAAPLLVKANDALDAFAMEGESVKPGSEASVLFSASAQQRDPVWRDYIDPELCLAERKRILVDAPSSSTVVQEARNDNISELSFEKEFDWQTADAEVNAEGQVRWLSWVSHIDGMRHAALLEVLAELLQVSLPQLELVCGQRLHSRRIQVVPRAYEQVMYGEDPLYKIAEWHTDGYPHERILATSACYVRMDSTLFGGPVDFASGADAWEDDPHTVKTVVPGQGAILVFNNAMLRHRVGPLGGEGRRRLIAFHVVDPEYCQVPRAMDLPRQLRSQGRLSILRTIAAVPLPSRCKVLIAHFAAEGSLAVDILRLRNEERHRKTTPMRRSFRDHSFRCATTISPLSSLSGREDMTRATWFRIARGR